MRNPLAAAVLAVSLMVSTAAQPSVWERVWSFLSVLWIEAFMDQADGGCGADPDGRCVPVEQPNADVGCTADPNGCPGSKK